tara:strand:- start:43 stop:336 length:294 start_codon:yes stop_codon:yes gene_type:complete
MAIFDNVVNKFDNFKGYEGNPPTTEAEYNALDCWKDPSNKPSWETILSSVSLEETRSLRAAAYPSWEDQLDNIYHNGVDAWKVDIKKIKDKYPKGDK